jgi:hypothetical protein
MTGPQTTLSGQADRPISNTKNQLLTTQVEVGFLGSLGPKGSTARLFTPSNWTFLARNNGRPTQTVDLNTTVLTAEQLNEQIEEALAILPAEADESGNRTIN